jgi:hypothetical protein
VLALDPRYRQGTAFFFLAAASSTTFLSLFGRLAGQSRMYGLSSRLGTSNKSFQGWARFLPNCITLLLCLIGKLNIVAVKCPSCLEYFSYTIAY